MASVMASVRASVPAEPDGESLVQIVGVIGPKGDIGVDCALLVSRRSPDFLRQEIKIEHRGIRIP